MAPQYSTTDSMIIIMDPEMMAMDSGSYVGGNKLKNTCYGRNIGKFSERLGQVAGLVVFNSGH